MEEEWKKKLKEEKRKHNLEVKQLKEEVGRGNRDRKSLQEKSKQDGELEQLRREVEKGIRERESLEGTIEIKEKRLEGLERYGNKMDELWKEACKKGD